MRPSLVAVDSIQTLVCGDLPSTPGSVSQVRESAYRLLGMAKKEGIEDDCKGSLGMPSSDDDE